MKNILDENRKEPLNNDSLEFLSSINEDLWILEEDVIGSIAHVIMLHERQILSAFESRKILKELFTILSSIKFGNFHVTKDLYEDIHPYNKEIVRAALKNEGLKIEDKNLPFAKKSLQFEFFF